MCLSLFLWYIRILHLFVASQQLGIKLLMIFDTVKFVSILLQSRMTIVSISLLDEGFAVLYLFHSDFLDRLCSDILFSHDHRSTGYME